MQIKLKKDEIDYLFNADFMGDSLRASMNENMSIENDTFFINLPEDIEIELYEILQYQLPKVGFDKNYDLTKEGKIIERIMDQLGED